MAKLVSFLMLIWPMKSITIPSLIGMSLSYCSDSLNLPYAMKFFFRACRQDEMQFRSGEAN
jgi:hypothetical protein